MRNRLLTAILMAVVVVAGAWLMWIRSAHGFSTNAKPTWIEAELAAISRRLALPGGQAEVKNPFPATPARLASAQALYHTQCELCHGTSGDGHTQVGESLYPKTPDLRGLMQNKSDGTLFYSIRNGIRMSGMPAWNRQDSDPQIWALVDLIRTFRVRSPEARPGAGTASASSDARPATAFHR